MSENARLIPLLAVVLFGLTNTERVSADWIVTATAGTTESQFDSQSLSGDVLSATPQSVNAFYDQPDPQFGFTLESRAFSTIRLETALVGVNEVAEVHFGLLSETTYAGDDILGATSQAFVQFSDTLHFTAFPSNLPTWNAGFELFSTIDVVGSTLGNATFSININDHEIGIGTHQLPLLQSADQPLTWILPLNLIASVGSLADVNQGHSVANLGSTIKIRGFTAIDSKGNEVPLTITSQEYGFRYANLSSAVPEPGSMTLATLGSVGLAVGAWRRRSRQNAA